MIVPRTASLPVPLSHFVKRTPHVLVKKRVSPMIIVTMPTKRKSMKGVLPVFAIDMLLSPVFTSCVALFAALVTGIFFTSP